jgi:heme-degrading monooxygenase HmoA
MTREHLASGNWQVKAGNEEEFMARWKDWIGASTASVPGFASARLLRDVSDALHFVSFSEWDDPGSRDAWKASSEFTTGLDACRALCEDFRGGDFSEVVSL